MYLYNSATHKKEEFKTHTPGHVEMYTCGPTVYHFAHIGNLRSYIMEDVLEKYLRYAGYSVNRVMNITDVGHLTSDADQGEDKMLKGARREHKTVMEIAQYYTDAFFEDCRKLNIKRPDVVQPATGLIDDYIKIITKLLDTNENLSVTKAAVFCAMDYLDEYRKSTGSAENMRSQIQDYIADATRAKLAEDKVKAENEVLRREAAALREQLEKMRNKEARREERAQQAAQQSVAEGEADKAE